MSDRSNEEKVLLSYLGLNLFERLEREAEREGGDVWTVLRYLVQDHLPERDEILKLDSIPSGEVTND